MSPRRLEASDKVTLLLSMVPFLMMTSPVSVHELAQRFDITEQQVKELIELLAVSGVPGDSGAYQHQDLFDINWDLYENENIVDLWNHVEVETTPKFSAREAAALVAGLQYISGLLPEHERPVVSTLLNKISYASSTLPENILVSPVSHNPFADLATTALEDNKVIAFTYHAQGGERQQRRVEPIRIDLVGTQQYLRGWCLDKDALRTFRFDRMTNVSITPESFDPRVKADELSEDLFSPSDGNIIVSCEIDSDVLGLLGAYQPVVREKSADHYLVDIHFGSIESVPVFVAQFPGSIRVISPPDAVTAVSQWAQRALGRYTA
jgi:proteasome accessory factor C